MASEGFDYVVVGAGSAGCVLAARLSEDPSVKVLLLEAGGPDSHPLIAMPLGWFKLMATPGLDWGYQTEPEPHLDGRRLPLPRGKVLGGCSATNGMMYSRGHPADYDQWAEAGLAGWSFADVLPYFRRSEASWRGASPHHGADGPLSVARHVSDDHVHPRLAATAEALGHRLLDDFHGEAREGFSAPDFTIRRGRRASTSAAFLRPALGRPNLTVRTGALAHRVVLENGRAVGVDLGGEVVRAEREVILCGGAYNSPQLLMLSGIGPADELSEAGVAPVHDLPGVGKNLQEHAALVSVYEAAGPFTFDRHLRLDRLALAALEWGLLGSGPIANLPIGIQGFVHTREGLDRPDLQCLIVPTAMDARVWFPGWRQRRGDAITVSNVLLHPQSRGWVKLASADPSARPRIQLNLLEAEADRQALIRFVRFTRAFFRTEPAASLVSREVLPDPALTTDADLLGYIRAILGTAMHPVGTCAMGEVLDAELRVRGIEGLRVADCSAMPTIVGGNTNAPAIMIAEKAADLVLGRSAPREEDG